MKNLDFNKLVICSIVFLLYIPSIGQNVTISGIVKSGKGKTINLIAYADRFTMTEKRLTTAITDSTGRFSFNIDLAEPIQTFININEQYLEIYIEPRKSYEIELNGIPLNSDDLKNKEGAVDYTLEILIPKKEYLNSLIHKFNLVYNDFILKEFVRIMKSRNKKVVDSMKTILKTEFADTSNKYFNNIIKYKTGYIEYFSKMKSFDEIEQTYFTNKPVLYENPEYMEFFNEFFNKYYSSSKLVSINELAGVVLSKGSFKDIVEIVKKDKLIENNDLRDLVVLKILNDLYHTNGFKQEDILRIIKAGNIEARSPKNKSIALNLYKILTKLQAFAKAPDFKLLDINEKQISLRSLKGKYVYLYFFKSNIPYCTSEFITLTKLQTQFKDKVEFINISCDQDKTQLLKFMKENPAYKFTFAYYNNDWELLNNYNIKSYPTFVFIDKEGDIISYPAPDPNQTGGIEIDKAINQK